MWKKVTVVYADKTSEELTYRDYGSTDSEYIFYTDEGRVQIPKSSVKKLIFI